MAEQTEPQTAPKRTVLWLKDIAERWGKSTTTIWRMRGRGEIPPPTMPGDTPGWAVRVIEMVENGWADNLVQAYNAQQKAQEQLGEAAQLSRKRAGEPRGAVQ